MPVKYYLIKTFINTIGRGVAKPKEFRMSQKQRVLDYLETHQTITSLDAFYDLGITRISAVVYNLKKDGHHLLKESVTVTNRHGEPCTVAKWSLPCI